jgi:hypothetical protein
MTGFATLKILRKFEQDIDELGLYIREAKNYADSYSGDGIMLSPRDDRLPHYSRDASIFIGTIEEAIYWVRGVQWAREYDRMIKATTPKKREEQEQKELNRQLMQTLSTGRKQEGKIIGITDEGEYYDDEEVPF